MIDKWEIQQKINRLRARKSDLEDDITKLNQRKTRIMLEMLRKGRQQTQVSEFFGNRRQASMNMRMVVEGNAAKAILEKYESIYGCGNENIINGNIGTVKDYLSKNCDKIDERISEKQIEISSINWQINCCYNDMNNLESEE